MESNWTIGKMESMPRSDVSFVPMALVRRGAIELAVAYTG